MSEPSGWRDAWESLSPRMRAIANQSEISRRRSYLPTFAGPEVTQAVEAAGLPARGPVRMWREPPAFHWPQIDEQVRISTGEKFYRPMKYQNRWFFDDGSAFRDRDLEWMPITGSPFGGVWVQPGGFNTFSGPTPEEIFRNVDISRFAPRQQERFSTRRPR